MFPSLAQLYTRVVMQSSNGRESGGIRHKLGSLFSPRGPQPASRGREDVEHAVFITADVLRVRARLVMTGHTMCACWSGVGTRSAYTAASTCYA